MEQKNLHLEVRKIFVEKMKSTARVHSFSTTAAVKIAGSPINNHFSQIFQKQGMGITNKECISVQKQTENITLPIFHEWRKNWQEDVI